MRTDKQTVRAVCAMLFTMLAVLACGSGGEPNLSLPGTTALALPTSPPTAPIAVPPGQSTSPPTQPTSSPTQPASPLLPSPTAPCDPVSYETPQKILELHVRGHISNMAAADFNGDGREDVVLDRNIFLSAETLPIEILLNDLSGGLREGTSEVFISPIPEVQHPRQMILEDFNGDDRTDIFIASHGQDAAPFPGYQNTLVLSVPGGRLTDATAGLPQQRDFTHSAAAADIDGDGDVDLFVGNIWGQLQVPPQIWLNDGSGGFSIASGRIPAQYSNLAYGTYTASHFADLNNDGHPDLILGASDGVSRSAVLLNDGGGMFSVIENAIPAKPWQSTDICLSIRSADLNGDGFQDALMAFTKGSYEGRVLQILINNGDGTFRDETSSRIAQSPNSDPWIINLLLLDLDGDGDLDITTQTMGGAPETLPAYVNDGWGTFSAPPFELSILHTWLYTFVDLDGDGGLDILTSYPAGESSPEMHFIARDLGCR